jgi:hypothetical protein
VAPLTLRIACHCGRNLADVTMSRHNASFTRDRLCVTPRPNVDQSDYRPWHAANRGGMIGSPGRAAATPSRVEGRDFDWHDRTYIWRCRCGKPWECRHERISQAWNDLLPNTGVVRILLGIDM